MAEVRIKTMSTKTDEEVMFDRTQELIERLNLVRPVIEEISYDEATNESVFVFSPLVQGYGTTVGNALRRVLISSVSGCAVTYLKFEGAKAPLHEYSNIPGIKEDGIELMMNLKGLRVSILDDSPVEVMHLEAKGVGEVTGADIKTNPNIRILESDYHIAYLTDDKSRLRMEIGLGRGTGYLPSERHVPEELNLEWGEVSEPPIGVILIDSKFSPVVKANYRVENTRVGQETELDKLFLEVKTNGAVTPKEALREAANILVSYFNLFSEFPVSGDDYRFEAEIQTAVDDILGKSVDELELPVRPANCLRKIGVRTIGELIEIPESDLLKIRNFGEKSLEEIKEKLEPFELTLSSGKRGK